MLGVHALLIKLYTHMLTQHPITLLHTSRDYRGQEALSMAMIDDHIMALAGSALLQLSEPRLYKGGQYIIP